MSREPYARPDVAARNLGQSRFAHAAARAERIARYTAMRSRGVTPDVAAGQVGVTPGGRTAVLYETEFQRASMTARRG